ncbi:MAG: pentapeptide repeat-containing protein [Clostridiales bacterium]|nr:pentapeptide repeat-containing protein [Clostridiales bacterium]
MTEFCLNHAKFIQANLVQANLVRAKIREVI